MQKAEDTRVEARLSQHEERSVLGIKDGLPSKPLGARHSPGLAAHPGGHCAS